MSAKSTSFGTPDFIFYGDRNHYPELMAKHDQDLQVNKIGYIKNVEEVNRRLQEPVYPERITAGYGGPEGREHEFKKRLTIFDTQSKAYNKNLEKIPEDFDVAAGLFTRRLSPAIRTEVEGFIRLDVNLPTRTKYNNMLQYIYNRYGPRDLTDIETLKSQLRRADDTQGYKNLMYLHRHIQNQLQKIQKRDPTTGAILTTPTGVPITHEFSQDELRSILMDQLGKSNEIFERVRLDAIKNPTKTYAQIVEECENLLKDNKVENYHLSYSSSRGNGDNLNSLSRPTISVGSTTINENTDGDDDLIFCFNCHQPNHRAAHCRSTTCFKCGSVFSTWRERSKHGAKDHGLSQNNNRNTNSYNNNTRERSRSPSSYNTRNYRSSSNNPSFRNSSSQQQQYNQRRHVSFNTNSMQSNMRNNGSPRRYPQQQQYYHQQQRGYHNNNNYIVDNRRSSSNHQRPGSPHFNRKKQEIRSYIASFPEDDRKMLRQTLLEDETNADDDNNNTNDDNDGNQQQLNYYHSNDDGEEDF